MSKSLVILDPGLHEESSRSVVERRTRNHSLEIVKANLKAEFIERSIKKITDANFFFKEIT